MNLRGASGGSLIGNIKLGVQKADGKDAHLTLDVTVSESARAYR